MKKKLIIFCFVALATVSAVFYVQSKSSYQDDLLLANVEALADDEQPYVTCRDYLSSTCESFEDKCCYFWVINHAGEEAKCFYIGYRNNI